MTQKPSRAAIVVPGSQIDHIYRPCRNGARKPPRSCGRIPRIGTRVSPAIAPMKNQVVVLSRHAVSPCGVSFCVLRDRGDAAGATSEKT
jgi:hypothetical protein